MLALEDLENQAKELGLDSALDARKEQGYGKGYIYDHDTPEGFSGQNYFPESMRRERYYRPVERGFEREIAKRLAWYDKLRREKNQG